MQITEKSLVQVLKEKRTEDIKVLVLHRMSINKFTLRTNLFDNIEFVSLRGNAVKDISFLANLNKIWYLDIRNNPVENFEVISYHNVFGFLGCSVDKYSVKNLLKLRKLNIGHWVVDYELDPQAKKYLLYHNPNVTKFNNEFLYYHDRKDEGGEILTTSPSKSKASYLKNNTMLFSSSIFDLENTNALEVKGEKINSLKSFYENFGTEMRNLHLSLSFLNKNPNNFQKDNKYLKLEKTKLINFAKIYESFFKISTDKTHCLDKGCFNIEELEKPEDVNNNPFNFDISMFKNNEYFPQMIILAVLSLYLLHIIKEDIAITVFKFLYKNLLKRKIQITALKKFLQLDKDILLCFYYYFYEHFVDLYDHSKGMDKFKYKDIKASLEMNKLVLLCNYLKENKTNEIIFNKNIPNEDRKFNINKHLVRYYYNQLEIFNDVLIIVQFISDFILYYKLDSILLQNHLFEYRVFMEIGFLFYNYLSVKNKEDVLFTDRDFRMHKFQTLGNTLEFVRKRMLDEDVKSKIGLDNKHCTISFFEEINLEKPKLVKSVDLTQYRLIPRGKKLEGVFKQTIKKEYKSVIENLEPSKPPIENIHEVFTTRLLMDGKCSSIGIELPRVPSLTKINSFRSTPSAGFTKLRENQSMIKKYKAGTSPFKGNKLKMQLPLYNINRMYSNMTTPRVTFLLNLESFRI
jgi:hypothetical protein